jgi:hyperosmotically inducible protein
MRAVSAMFVSVFVIALGCARPNPDSAVPVRVGLASDDVPDVDNSAVNARDRDGTAPTPLDQGQSQPDIDITAAIRMRVVSQPFSINGQNIKIITQGGKVTLRGPVASAKEQEQIEKIAVAIAGEGNVTSMLDVERN